MTVGDKNIRPAIVVKIEKEAAESESNQGRAAHFRLRRLVNEQSVALVVIQRDHLVGKVADDDAGVTAAIVVGGVGAHSRAGNAILAEPDARRHAALLERSILLIQLKLVGVRVLR